MKVLVNFGEVRCIVPVGDGNLPVRHVIDLAIDRYKKAVNTPSTSSVIVHNLKTCRDGAILDPDDIVSDVADDREQIIAFFEVRDTLQELSKLKNGVDLNRISTSTPSDSFGTGSPDVFINEDRIRTNSECNEIIVEDMNRKNMPNITINYNDVEITSEQINSGVCATLQVRRGSEPVLNRMSPDIDVCDPTKRWSTAVAVDSKNNRNASTHSLDVNSEHSDEDKDKSILSSNSLSPPSIKEEGYGSEEKSDHTPTSTTSNTFSRFSRGSGRLSMIANNLDVWAEAADRSLRKSFNRDKSPTKISLEVNKNYNSLPKRLNYDLAKTSISSMSSEDNTKFRNFEDKPSVIINLAKESGPLGIHVVPDSDDVSYANGLLIQGIEPGGRIDRDGRLHVGDTIIEINGQSILDVDFESAQQIFRSALQSDEITLRLVKYNQNQNSTEVKRPFPPPVLPKPANILRQHEELLKAEGMVEGEQRDVQQPKVATVTSTKNLAASVVHKPVVSSALVVGNTRRIGKKYHIQLKKGSEGLGFSITTRDNPTGGNLPIYIKNILPKGAAVEDGRLRPGDRLLEVCGIEMTGKPQSEAVKILRTIPLGTTVDLIVSRQEPDLSPSPMMPRQLPPEKSGDISCSNEREVLTFEIPLNDTGSAGLGVSVKGKTSTSSGQHTDLGIFVKSVIHGGAASKDGRLMTNDQLININGIPLLGMSNSQAMETLRRAMIQSEGPIANPNAITLTVARKLMNSSSLLNSSCHQRNDSLISAASNDSCNEESGLSSANETFYIQSNKLDDTYDNSYRSTDNTVIYKPKSDVPVMSREENSESQSVSTPKEESPNKPVINQTFLKQFYLSENHDSNKIYEKSPNILSRSDVIIERDAIENRKPSIGAESCVSDSRPEATPRDSQLSLSEENADGFRRDGFGRQSMSEKRHAQLDAKNTDTYRRNKKAKEEKEKHLRDRDSESEQRDQSVTDVKSHIKTETNDDIPHELVPNILLVNQRSTSCESLTLTHLTELQNNCPYTERKCRSPGSCPYHSTHTGAQKSVNQNKDLGPALGMRKSASLESLQTLMQDLQKEQFENENAFTGPRHKTVRVSRSRETNESFRAAVDKSYDVNNDENHETMETVAEEGSDSGSSMENINQPTHSMPIRGPSGALSMASTQCTATTATSSQMTTEDETQAILKKKKKGLLKTLFKFGSKKGRSSKQKTNKEQIGEPIMDPIAAQNANQMYLLEQERIQMHYKRLMEQQQQQQHLHHQQSPQVSQTAQPTPPARQRSKSAIGERFGGVQPMHSTPTGVTANQLTNQGINNETPLSRNERMVQLRAQHQRMHVERHRVYPNEAPIYDTYSSMDRKHQLEYIRRGLSPPNHSQQIYISYPINANCPPPRRLVVSKIEPIYNENNIRKYKTNAFERRTASLRCSANNPKLSGADVQHSRGNSYDIYRQAMERPGSRVGIADHNSKYSHYMNYREIQQQMHHYHQQQQRQQEAHQQLQQYHQNRQIYGQTSASNVIPPEAMRQMMKGQHQRQVSSPVSHRQERPISNYYEYETASALMPNPKHQPQNNVNNNVLPQIENSSSTSLTRRSKKYTKPESIGSPQSGPPIPVPIVRQQQPIYQTNQLKIYGSTYSNGYSGHSQSQPNPPQVPIYDTIQGNSNTNNPNSSNGYQMPSKYQSLRPGSKFPIMR